MKKKLTYLFLAFAALVIASCSDDLLPNGGGDINNPGGWVVTLEEASDTALICRGRYGDLLVHIAGYTEADGDVLVSSSADWFALDEETLPSDSIVSYDCDDNTGARRQVTLRFTAANNPSHYGTITLTQASPMDDGTNEGTLTPFDYVGYGYNIYKAAYDKKALSEAPVIDVSKLHALAPTKDVVYDSRLNSTNTTSFSSYSLREYSSNLTKQVSETDVYGCKTDCEKVANTVSSISELETQNIGRGTMVKIVGARTIDEGFLKRQISQGARPYTDAFNSKIALIEYYKSQGETKEMKTEIRNLITYFGTHIVVQSYVGGRLDYVFTLDKDAPGQVSELVSYETNYTFGNSLNATTNQEGILTSQKKNGYNVVGGIQAAIDTLKKEFESLKSTARLRPQTIVNWLSSISYDNIESQGLVKCKLLPIWDVVPLDLKTDVMNAVYKRGSTSSYKLNKELVGTDNYRIDLKNIINFSDDPESSLCRIIYNSDGAPFAEICNEYIPKIRTDKRVTVVYPIFKNRMRMNQGLFIGDGVHKPAYVGFSGSECYVSTIDSLSNSDIITEIDYLHGNLYLKNPALNLSPEGSVYNDILSLTDGAHRPYPIVKIGANFWTRADAYHQLLFAEKETDSTWLDQVIDDVLYAKTVWESSAAFMRWNEWIYGYDPLTIGTKLYNQHWYFPSSSEVKSLYAYIGNNVKSLFHNQASGFEAQFNGYYGSYDILDDSYKFFNDIRYKLTDDNRTSLNIIASKEQLQYGTTSCLMVLTGDYRLYLFDDYTLKNGSTWSSWRENLYPVRLTRGAFFKYPNLGNWNNNSQNYNPIYQFQ